LADEKIEIGLEASGNAAKAIDDVIKRLDSLEKTIEKGNSSVKRSGEVFAGVFSSQVLIGSIKKLGDVARELFQTFVVQGIHAAQEQADALNKLSVAFALAGRDAKQSTQDFKKFAEGLEAVTTFSDDAIISSGAFLETLTRLDQEGLQKATVAAADLAAALGVSLEEATSLVAKAANGNVSALQRQGIEIRKGTTDAQTFANTLETLNSRFGGAAQAQVNTFSGALSQASNRFNNLQEAIGGVVVENKVVIDGIKEVSKLFDFLSASVGKNEKELKIFAGETLVLLVKSASAALSVIQDLINGAEFLGDTFQIAIAPVKGIATAFDSFANKGKSALDSIKDAFAGFKEDVTDAATPAVNFSHAISEVDQVGIKLEGSLSRVGRGVENVSVNVLSASSAMVTFSDAQIKAGEEGLKLIEKYKNTGPLDDFIIKLDQINQAFLQGKISAQESADAQVIATEEANIKQIEALQKRNEALLVLNDEQSIAELEQNNLKINSIISAEESKNAHLAAIRAANGQDISLSQDASNASTLDKQNKLTDAMVAAKAKQVQKEKELEAQKVSAVSQSFGNLATLTKTGNKELFEIGKAAALAQATVDGYAAIQKALSSAPPPFNFILAATVGVATGVQIANIASQKLATGMTEIPGTGLKDNFPAILAPGERVLSRDQNRDLKDFINSQESSRDILLLIAERIGNQGPISVSVGGEQIFNAVNEQVRNGRRLSA